VSDPKYKTLFDALKADILKGKYASGQPFPSVRALVQRYGIARSTIVHAMDELCHQGLIMRKQGCGTFVTSHGASRKIGFIVPSVSRYELFPPILAALTRLSREAGYALVCSDNYSSDGAVQRMEVRNLAERLIRDHVAGVIFQPLDYASDEGKTNRSVLEAFRRANVPVVLLDSDVVPPPQRSEHDLVAIDNLQAGETVARHLINAGARRICFVTRPNWWPNAMNRMRGVQLAVVANGHRWTPDNVWFVDSDDFPNFRKCMTRKRPDALVCEDDELAAVIRQYLSRLGLRVPNDVMLVGFDDVRIANLVTPPLTTIHQPYEEIASAAFERLLKRIADPRLLPTEIFLPATLVTRGSTR